MNKFKSTKRELFFGEKKCNKLLITIYYTSKIVKKKEKRHSDIKNNTLNVKEFFGKIIKFGGFYL